MTQTGVKLRDRLTQDKKGIFENSILTHVETLYENYPQPKCFTSHGVKHCARVEARLDEIIPEPIKSDLNEAEIFRLLSGVWFHDVGMLRGLLIDDNKLTDQEIREHHHERSRDYVLESGNRLNFFHDDPEKDHIARLCLYHRRSEDISLLPASERVGDDNIQLRLLAACLRLADALDLDFRRIRPPKELRSCIHYGMPIDQWIFWLKHAIVWGVDVQHGQHKIELHLKVPSKTENLENIEFTLLSNLLLDEVKAELESIKDVFGEYKIPLIDVSLKPKTDDTPGPDIMSRVEKELLWQLVVAVANINLPRWPNAGRVVDILLETIRAMLDGLKPTEIKEEIKKLLEWSVTKRGYYGLYRVYNDISRIIKQTTDESQLGEKITTYINDFQRDAKDQLKQLSEKGVPLVINGDSILVFGYSSCVLSVLKKAWEEGTKNVKIYVAESRNKSVFSQANERVYNDGVEIAKKAKKIGFKEVYLFSDASLGHYIDSKRINKVLLGANGIDLEGSAIHSIGHLTVALVAHHFNIPVYIFAESYKVLSKEVTETLKDIEKATSPELVGNWLGEGFIDMAGIHVLKPTSDMIPSKFLTLIVTDKGIMVPNQLGKAYGG